MNKRLLLILCFIPFSFPVFSQEVSSKAEIADLIEEVSKTIFKDPKIQLMDIDDVVSEVENKNQKNVNNIQNSVKNDSTVKSINELQENLLNEDAFGAPFKEDGKRPGLNYSELDMNKRGFPSKEIPQLPSEKLSSVAPEGLLPELLGAPSLKELPPIPGSKIKTKYLNLVDSIRQINLADGKMKLSEKVDGKSKEVIIKEKQSIKERMYFEGLVGVLGDNIKMINISPALGYQMMKKYSMGLGPNIAVNQGNNNPLSIMGLRSFAKYEIIKRKIYVQIEDVAVPLKQIKDGEEGTGLGKRINHSFSIGGGYLLHLNKSSALNFSFIYRVNKNNLSFEDLSPLSFRLGVSSFRNSKKNKL